MVRESFSPTGSQAVPILLSVVIGRTCPHCPPSETRGCYETRNSSFETTRYCVSPGTATTIGNKIIEFHNSLNSRRIRHPHPVSFRASKNKGGAPGSASSCGDSGRAGRKANTLQQMLESWVAAQTVYARIYVKIDKPMGVLLVAFLQIFKSEVFLS